MYVFIFLFSFCAPPAPGGLKYLSLSCSGSVTGVKMNKQPSKESLRDKLRGVFSFGPTRPHSKQTESKPSEFIITLDVLMVRDAPTDN